MVGLLSPMGESEMREPIAEKYGFPVGDRLHIHQGLK
jgi:hypothetical protein